MDRQQTLKEIRELALKEVATREDSRKLRLQALRLNTDSRKHREDIFKLWLSDEELPDCFLLGDLMVEVPEDAESGEEVLVNRYPQLGNQ
ncbi:hypothetical protein [Endozoicomonas euniceicola]|uniref:Uncharacterized protein n=1 Tax=Endozoicomonas euniceicola TaxID=1234143 RepID=A0ABY6GNG6_9GAMM|nr:hypothetical protein [Endozoicomonas euniceicola]UYM14277.1 hypothetical protein NX720_15370 [Endozoicomonas euniceicola]